MLATLYPALGWLVGVGGIVQHQNLRQVNSLLGWRVGVGGTAQHQDVREVDSLLGRPPGEVVRGHRGHSHETMLAVLAGRGRILANILYIKTSINENDIKGTVEIGSA
jgi:hypothetical protein